MIIPTPVFSIPSYVSEQIGGNPEIRIVASRFFDTIPYLPIISKKIFYELLNPLLPWRADAAFLCLCMKVVLWSPLAQHDDPQTTDYLAAKRYLSELESGGVFTMPMLQGRVILSMYEMGHGIYPAAYSSIAASSAHGCALRLSGQKDAKKTGKSLTWIEEEEQRRVWWAIVILERYVIVNGSS